MILVTTAGKVGSETVRLLRERDLPVRVKRGDRIEDWDQSPEQLSPGVPVVDT